MPYIKTIQDKMNKVEYHYSSHESSMADWLTEHPDIDVIGMCADHAGYFYVFYRKKEDDNKDKKANL